MDLAKWLQAQWSAISSAPAVYLGTVIIVWIAAMAFARYLPGDEAAAAKQRAEPLKQRQFKAGGFAAA